MTRQSSESLRGGGIGTSQIGPVGSQVVARPVDTTVVQAENDFTRLANALQGFLPGYSQYVAQEEREKRQRWEEEERARGAADAQLSEISTTEAAIQAYSTDASPVALSAFRKQLGARAFREAQAAFAEHAAQNFDPNNPDPNYAKEFAKDFFSQRIGGMQDPLFLESYADGVTRTVERFSSSHIGKIVEDHQAQKFANVTSAVQGFLESDSRPSDWVDQLKRDNPYLDKVSIENAAWTATLEHAVNTGRPEILEDFTRDTADGLKGYVYRGGPQVLKQYLDAKARAMHAFNQKTKVIMKGYEAQMRMSLDEDLKNIETFQTDIDMGKVEQMTEHLMAAAMSGVLPEGAAAEYRQKYYSAFMDIQKLTPVAEAYLEGRGSYDFNSLDPKDQQRVQRLAARLNPAVNPRDAAIRNGSLLDEDKRLLVNVANFVGNTEGGEMPTNIAEAYQVMDYYLLADGGAKEEVFWHNLSKGNPEAFHFWTNMRDALQHDPNKDLQTITATAKMLTANRNKTVKYDGQAAQDVVEKVSRKISGNDEAGWFGPEGERSNTYVHTWIRKEMEMQRTLNPNATEDSVMNTVAQKFKASHVLVGKSWVDISTMAHRPTPEETKEWGEALEQYKSVLFLKEAADLKFNWKAEDLDNYEVSLRPVPQTFNRSGEPLFNVFINGVPMVDRVNLPQLHRQFKNREGITQQAIQNVDAVLTRLEQGFKNPTEYSTAHAEHDRETLVAAREIGLVSDKQFKQYSQLVDSHQKRAKGEEFKMEEADKRKAIRSSAYFGPMTQAPEQDILIKARPANDLLDPKMGDVHKYVRDNAEKKPQYALAALVYGRSGMTYEQEGEQRVGFGYKFDANDRKELREAMSKAGVVGNIGFDVVTAHLRDKKARLSSQQAEKLFDYQLKKAQGLLVESMGAGEFALGTPEMQYGLSTLVTTFGNPNDVPRALELIKAGDFKGLTPMMTRVPASNRDSALAYIRALMSGGAHFRALVEQRVPNR